VPVAPSSFTIKALDESGRAKIAEHVCETIDGERKKVIEGLVHVLLNGTVPERIGAAEKLGELADEMAVPFLMTSVTGEKKQDPNVRLACVAALGNIADPASARVLIHLLDDDDMTMAQAALDALSVMTEADPPYAFVEGSTVKIRKGVKADWNKKLEAGYFKELKQD
jgi:HEAT repeat protein